MSYSICIEVSKSIFGEVLISKIQDPNVEIAEYEHYRDGSLHNIRFWVPGHSSRGVQLTVLDQVSGYQIVLNRFSSNSDIALARHLTHVICSWLNVGFRGDDMFSPALAEEVYKYLNESWASRMYRDGLDIVKKIQDTRQNQTILGPVCAFTIGEELLKQFPDDMDIFHIYNGLVKIAAELQNRAYSENVYVPRVLDVHERSLENENMRSISAFSLPLDQYTISQDADFVVLSLENGRFKWLHISDLEEMAQARSWEYFDEVRFAIPPLSAIDYAILMDAAVNRWQDRLPQSKTVISKPEVSRKFWRRATNK